MWDAPGNGWSDYAFVSQGADPLSYLPGLIGQISEDPPYILMGWGGGGDNFWRYANAYPNKTAALVFLDVYAPFVEWRTQQFLHNYSAAETVKYRGQQLWQRFGLFRLIRGIAAPLGLMGLIVSPDKTSYAWPERWDEYRWFFATQKTWTSQLFGLRDSFESGYDADFSSDDVNSIGMYSHVAPALRGKPLLQVMSVKISPEKQLCVDAKPPLTGKDCQTAVRANAFMERGLVRLSEATGNGMLWNCTDPKCDLGFPLRFPQVAVEAIDHYFGNMTR
jgi:pimeloyl-ACP methyl ester carboxylesterase